MVIQIYKFNSLEDCKIAIDNINSGEGIPVNDEATTRTYCNPNKKDDYWYLIKDSVTSKYLKDDEELTIEETPVNG